MQLSRQRAISGGKAARFDRGLTVLHARGRSMPLQSGGGSLHGPRRAEKCRWPAAWRGGDSDRWPDIFGSGQKGGMFDEPRPLHAADHVDLRQPLAAYENVCVGYAPGQRILSIFGG